MKNTNIFSLIILKHIMACFVLTKKKKKEVYVIISVKLNIHME